MTSEKWPHALLVNDIHIGKDTILEFHTNWNEALEVCQRMGIQEIVIGGDLWQSRSSQTLPVLLAVRQAILKATQLGIEIVIAEGNHCKIDQEPILGYSHIFDHYPNVSVIDDFIIEDMDGGLVLAVMSYFPENGSFINKLNELKATENPANTILYIHEGINGALAQNSDKELSASVFKPFRKVLVGHYHDRCKVGENIEYIGASRQHNYGEDEKKGYTVLFSDGSTQFVQNQVNVRYATITVTPDNISSAKEKIEKLIQDGVKIKVKVECHTDEVPAINKQTLLEMGVSKVEVKTETISVESAAQAISTKYDKAGIKNEYINFCHKKEIDDIETGLQYLDKIN